MKKNILKISEFDHFKLVKNIVSQLAHDLISPTSMLQYHINDNSNNRESQELALDSISQLNSIIERLSQFDTINTIQRTPISLNHLVNSQIKINTEKIARKLGVKLEYCINNELWINIDELKLGRALSYLVENSIYFVSNSEEKKCIITSKQSNNDLIIEISSNDSTLSSIKNLNDYHQKKTTLNTIYSIYVIQENFSELFIKSKTQDKIIYGVKIPNCIISYKYKTVSKLYE